MHSAAAWEGGGPAPPPVPHSGSGSAGSAASGGQAWGEHSGGARPLRRVQLVRDFIHDSLYHTTEGYFSKQTATGGAACVRFAVRRCRCPVALLSCHCCWRQAWPASPALP